MRGLWRGERVTLDGEVIRLAGARLDFEPEFIPEIWVAGRGPQVLADGRRGGRRSPDGKLRHPARRVDYAREQIERGPRGLGPYLELTSRSPPGSTCPILDDEDEAVPEDALRGVSHALWSSRSFFREHLDDFADDVTDEFRTFMNEAPHEWSPEVMSQLRSPDPAGPVRQPGRRRTPSSRCRAHLDDLRAAGVQHW